MRSPYPFGGGSIVITWGQSHAHYDECADNIYHNSHFHNGDMYSIRRTSFTLVVNRRGD